MTVTIELDDDLATQLAARGRASEQLDGVVARMLRDQLELTDGKSEPGGALAILLDEIGASARGELALPDHETLRSWLVLLCKVARLRPEPD